MSRTASQEMFAHIVNRDEDSLALDVAALLIGDWHRPEDVPVARHLAELDRFARVGLDALAADGPRPFAVIGALNRALFGELGFRGNEDDYYDPRNSFLHEVIDRRTGIPITLSVVYIEVARRMGVDVRGVSFPGHFLVRYDHDGHTMIVDPFRLGMVLDGDALRQLLRRASGDGAELTPELLAPAGKKQILTRILANLAGIYGRGGEVQSALEVLERMLILDPGNHRLEREVRRLRERAMELN